MPKGTKNKSSKNEKNDLIGNDENKYTLDLVNGWIVTADNKISIAFAVFSVVFGLLNYFSIKDLAILKTSNEKMYYLALILLVASALIFVGSIVLYFLCLLPNLSSKGRKKQYSLFYGEIATFDCPEDYNETSKTVTKDLFNKELCYEIFYNSKICKKKMRLFGFGLILSLSSIILSIAVFVFVLLNTTPLI